MTSDPVMSFIVIARRGTRRGNPEQKSRAFPYDSGLLHIVRNDGADVAIQSKITPLPLNRQKLPDAEKNAGELLPRIIRSLTKFIFVRLNMD